MAQALQGRGTELGQTLVSLDKYLKYYTANGNQVTNTFISDLKQLSQVSDLYNQAAPALLSTLHNLETTSTTLIDEKTSFEALLTTGSATSDVLRSFLAQNRQSLITLTGTSQKVYRLLAEYSPEYACLVDGLAALAARTDSIIQGDQFRLSAVIDNTNLGAYKQGQEPVLITGFGPHCFGLPDNPQPIVDGKFQIPAQFQCLNDGAPLTGNPCGKTVTRSSSASAVKLGTLNVFEGSQGENALVERPDRPRLSDHARQGAVHRDDAVRSTAARGGGDGQMRAGLLGPLIKLLIFLVVTSVATYVLAATIANTELRLDHDLPGVFHRRVRLAVRRRRPDRRRAGGHRQQHQRGQDAGQPACRAGPARQGRLRGQGRVHRRQDQPLPVGVVVNLRYRNLVGQRYLEVQEGAGDSTTSNLNPKDVIPLTETTNAVDLTVLFNGFQPLFQGLDAGSINNLSRRSSRRCRARAAASRPLRQPRPLTNSIADKDAVVGQVIDNLNSVLTTIGQRDTELDQLIVQLQSFVSGLAGDRTAIGSAIDGINNLANSTAGLLQTSVARWPRTSPTSPAWSVCSTPTPRTWSSSSSSSPRRSAP